MKKWQKSIEIKIHATGKMRYELLHTVDVQINIKGYLIQIDFITLRKNGHLIINKGYRWDGASGAVDTMSFILGSLIHDAGYQLLRLGLLPSSRFRRVFDRLLFVIVRANGMPVFRACYVYIAVRLFGAKFAKSTGEKS